MEVEEKEMFTQCRVRVDRAQVVNELALKSLDEQGCPVGIVMNFTRDEDGKLLAGVMWPEGSYLSRWWYPEHLEQITSPSISQNE